KSASHATSNTTQAPPSSTAHTPRARDHPRGSRHKTQTGRSRQRHRRRTTPNDPPEANHADLEEAKTTVHDHTPRSSEPYPNSQAPPRQNPRLNRPFVRQPRVKASVSRDPRSRHGTPSLPS